MKIFVSLILGIIGFYFPFGSCAIVSPIKDPLNLAKLIGDKLIRETPFAYRLELASDGNIFNGMQMIDFERNFPVSGKTSAYAYTRLEAPDNKVEPTSYGAVITSTGGRKDYIFRNDKLVKVDETGLVFSGTAGFIREREAGQQEWALFHGNMIGNSQFCINTTDQDAAISAIFYNSANISGKYSGKQASDVKFKWSIAMPDHIIFYLDGAKQQAKVIDGQILVNIPAGKHIWNLTVGLPCLPRPEIDFTWNENGKVLFAVRQVTGASSYLFEYNTDVGKNWTKLNEQTKSQLQIKATGNETKGYVRAVAQNKEHESEASVVYPVYFTQEKPHYPDGLKLSIGSGKIDLTWGKVLGCNEYKLYRRVKDSAKFQLIYSGNKNQFIDSRLSEKDIYEYAITAVNGNGESRRSNLINTDPSSWLNFDPMPGEPFRRSVNLYDGSRDNSGNPVDLYYPE